MQITINSRVLALVEEDIAGQATDAIVNAANSSLILGAGVAGAIRSKGGPTIQEACHQIGHCPVGGAVITGGGDLKAKHVIHAVGPRMGDGDEDAKLKDATLSSLKVAEDNQLKSVAFPALSTGIFGFPVERCAEIMLSNTIDYLEGETGLEKIVFCLFGQEAFEVFESTLKRFQ
jgi:O-acetyl-ADP-ribose deacetylase (regulator of RNase III)